MFSFNSSRVSPRVIISGCSRQEYGLKSKRGIKTYYVFAFQLAIRIFGIAKKSNNSYITYPVLFNRLLFKVLKDP